MYLGCMLDVGTTVDVKKTMNTNLDDQILVDFQISNILVVIFELISILTLTHITLQIASVVGMLYESGLSEISDTVGSWSDVDGLREHLMMMVMVVVLGSELKGEVPPLDSITPQSQNEHLGKG